MNAVTDLPSKRCTPCEGGMPPLSRDQVHELLKEVPRWQLHPDGKHIHREWKVKDFAAAMAFLQEVGRIAEAEGHHPDLHLTGYRNVAIDVSTHAVNGLTQNDFILAAKIDEIPVNLKK